MRARRFAVVAVLCLTPLAVTACGGDDTGGGSPDGAPSQDGAPTTDAPSTHDAPSDTSMGHDSSPDVEPGDAPAQDGGGDAGSDVEHEASDDGAADATGDGGGDDAGMDVVVIDTGIDAAPDTGVDAAPDVGADAPDAGADGGMVYPAFMPPLPQVITAGGPVLKSPRIIPILYAGNTLNPQILDFLSKLPNDPYYTTAVGEYGVGAPNITAPVTITDPAPTVITSDQIVTWLVQNVNAAGAPDGGSGWPVPDNQSIYVVFYPPTTTVEFGMGGPQSCKDFGAYHDELDHSRGMSTYAVMPQCSNYLGLGGLDFVTGATTHELLEASTDPFVGSMPAYDDVDFNGSGWAFTSGGGEVGDVCKLDPEAFFKPATIGYTVQRTWSNASAKAAHDPCLPHIPGEDVYFNAFPPLEATTVYPGYVTSGLKIPPGTSRTVEIRLFSDAPTTGPWTLKAEEKGSPQVPPDPNNYLSFAFDKPQGQNGDIVHLTITRKPLVPGDTEHGLAFVIESTLGTKTNVWWSVVGD